jgi:hypothetical protein
MNDSTDAGTEAGATRNGAVAGPTDEPRSRARTYAAVAVLEALVIAALWWFSRHFSA